MTRHLFTILGAAAGTVSLAVGASALAARPQTPPPEDIRVSEAETPSPVQAGEDTLELYRLRIVNRREGAIQVSTDGGDSWRLIGRVATPATTAAEGYKAAHYMEPGHVAAVAVHGIRMRVGEDDRTLHDPLVLSIDPAEYGGAAQDKGKGYGGLVTGSAGILTDIPAGTGLFRELAPLVGNPIYLESSTGSLRPLPPGFRPKGQGETLVIPTFAPRNNLVEVTFENRRGGSVTARFADGTTRPVTQVIKPVAGTGRFDGTSYTGVGRLNTNHTGVITVSTAPRDNGGGLPEGVGKERRGGFQIAPASHVYKTEEEATPVMMTLGDPTAPNNPALEATAPLFRGTISLGDAATTTTDGAISGDAIVEIAIDGGKWEPLPTLVGFQRDVFTASGMNRLWKARGIARTCTQGVTAFRLRVPARSPARSLRAATAIADSYRVRRYAAARTGATPVVKGILTINANPTNRSGVSFVRLRVEGVPRGFTNIAPFALTWDTRTVADGDYLLEADALDDAGAVLATTRRRVFVLNHPADPKRAVAVGKTSAD